MSKNNKIGALKQFAKLISTFSGRDKFNKTLQYVSKTSSFALNDPEIVGKLKKLDSGLSTARKVDRLFWSLVDIQAILDAINDSNTSDALKVISIIGGLASAYHWYTDNVIFLSKINFLDNVDTNAVATSGAKGDFIGIAVCLYLLYLSINQEEDEKTLHLKKVRFFGSFCDLICAFNDCGALEKITGQKMNAGQYGVAGLSSALATVYRVWNS
eukprot:UN08652